MRRAAAGPCATRPLSADRAVCEHLSPKKKRKRSVRTPNTPAPRPRSCPGGGPSMPATIHSLLEASHTPHLGTPKPARPGRPACPRGRPAGRWKKEPACPGFKTLEPRTLPPPFSSRPGAAPPSAPAAPLLEPGPRAAGRRRREPRALHSRPARAPGRWKGGLTHPPAPATRGARPPFSKAASGGIHPHPRAPPPKQAEPRATDWTAPPPSCDWFSRPARSMRAGPCQARPR